MEASCASARVGSRKERELTLEFRRWKRRFIEDTPSRVGFTAAGTRPSSAPRVSRRTAPASSKTSSRARRAFC